MHYIKEIKWQVIHDAMMDDLIYKGCSRQSNMVDHLSRLPSVLLVFFLLLLLPILLLYFVYIEIEVYKEYQQLDFLFVLFNQGYNMDKQEQEPSVFFDFPREEICKFIHTHTHNTGFILV